MLGTLPKDALSLQSVDQPLPGGSIRSSQLRWTLRIVSRQLVLQVGISLKRIKMKKMLLTIHGREKNDE
jgi:hypothetical protein